MPISSIILAGGRATRMGGTDKGLVKFQQKPLIQHVIKRLVPQVDEIIINANRSIAEYQLFGCTVLQDESQDFMGPLAGISLGLKYAKYNYLLTVPCDSPLLPLDLAERLMDELQKNNADIAVAKSNDNVQPVIFLSKKDILHNLLEYLNQGGHKVNAWQKSLNYIEVDFSENINAFVNLNTYEDLATLEQKFRY